MGYIATGIGQIGGGALLLTASALTVWGLPIIIGSSIVGTGTGMWQLRKNKKLAEETIAVLKKDQEYVEELKRELQLFNDTTILEELVSYFNMSTKLYDAYNFISYTGNFVSSSYSSVSMLSSGSFIVLGNALSLTGGILSTLMGGYGLLKESDLETYIKNVAVPSLEENTELLDKTIDTLKYNYNRTKFLFSNMTHNNTQTTQCATTSTNNCTCKSMDCNSNSNSKCCKSSLHENNLTPSDQALIEFLSNMHCFDCKGNFQFSLDEHYVCESCGEEYEGGKIPHLHCAECSKFYCTSCMVATSALENGYIYTLIFYFKCRRHSYMSLQVQTGCDRCSVCSNWIKPGDIKYFCATCNKPICKDVGCFFKNCNHEEPLVKTLHLKFYKMKKREKMSKIEFNVNVGSGELEKIEQSVFNKIERKDQLDKESDKSKQVKAKHRKKEKKVDKIVVDEESLNLKYHIVYDSAYQESTRHSDPTQSTQVSRSRLNVKRSLSSDYSNYVLNYKE